jgi:hypothetical protein
MLPNWEVHPKWETLPNWETLSNWETLLSKETLPKWLILYICGYLSQKYVGFHAPFLGRVFAFKYDRSGKVAGFFVKYSPLGRGVCKKTWKKTQKVYAI